MPRVYVEYCRLRNNELHLGVYQGSFTDADVYFVLNPYNPEPHGWP